MLASILLADVLGCDYSSYGVLVVIMGYFMFLRSGSLPQMALFYLILTALFFSQSLSLCLMQSMGVIAYGIIYGTRHLSEKRWSRFFYWFYPLHMVLLGVIRWLQLYR